ncbi:unnamed protein product [Calicophoron daubneyi]|uniref:G-protein coupled receptors family 1 profile domain-containing protein n=1 Tax=Calicophoron daubneyi TaxID=300641 RepID=A0AAV2T2F0_CALDB
MLSGGVWVCSTCRDDSRQFCLAWVCLICLMHVEISCGNHTQSEYLYSVNPDLSAVEVVGFVPAKNNGTSISSDSTNWNHVQAQILPVVLLLVASIGLVGNALNFIVLHAYHTSQITFGGECTARVNLIGLATADFFVCLTTLPLGYVRRRHKSFSFMLFYALIGPAMATYFLTVSVWMVLLMSVVRYLAVCRPLTSRTCLTSRNMFRVIVIIYFLALIFHIPSFITYTYEEKYIKRESNCTELHSNATDIIGVDMKDIWSSKCENPRVTILITERKFWNHHLVQMCYHIMHILLGNIVPFIGVVVSNIAVIRACKRSDECRRSFMRPQSVVRDGSVQRTNSQPPVVYKTPTNSGKANFGRNAASVMVLNPSTQLRLSLQRFPNRAANRVTPLLLAVILAFLLFTAPFGIVHLVCLHVMREMGARVRNDTGARRLYMALNLTVEWTNAIQLLGCASNFFLYFLVSTTFRRTTKRTFQRLYNEIKDCRSDLLTNIFLGKTSGTSQSWDKDTRTNALRRELDYELANPCVRRASPREMQLFYCPPKPHDDLNITNSKNKFSQKISQIKSHLTRRTVVESRPTATNTAYSSPLPRLGSTPSVRFGESSNIEWRSCGSAGCDVYPFVHHLPPYPGQMRMNAHCPGCCKLIHAHCSLPGSMLLRIKRPTSTLPQDEGEADQDNGR